MTNDDFQSYAHAAWPGLDARNLQFFWKRQDHGCRFGGVTRLRIIIALLFVSLALPLHSRAAQTNLLFSISNSWCYQQFVNLDGIPWNQPDFDDSFWPIGQGLLADETCGCLPEVIRTDLAAKFGGYTFYFRTQFVYTGDPWGVSLLFSNLLDDGAIFYLNGTEIQRVGMAAGAVTFTNTSSRSVNNA